MQPINATVGPLDAADPNGIAETQTVTGAANLVLDGALVVDGVAVLDAPRQIILTSAGNDSSITFTIYGTTYGGNAASETITGGNGSAVATVLNYQTVTQITTSGSTSVSGVIAGTNGVATSRWVRLDSWALPSVNLQVDVSGTVNYTVQTTNDDPNDPFNPVAPIDVTWFSSTDSAVVNQTAAKQSSFTNAPTYVRLLLNSGTGTVTGTFIQYGNVPY